MKIVLFTQIRENYGAHDWDGQGEVPQRWKMKGGNTYVVHNVSVNQSMSRKFWKKIEKAVESFGDMFEEYCTASRLVDDIDYKESDHCPEWDAPINLTYVTAANPEGEFLAVRHSQSDFTHLTGIESKLEQWKQVDGQREDYRCLFNMEDGRILTLQEYEKEAA